MGKYSNDVIGKSMFLFALSIQKKLFLFLAGHGEGIGEQNSKIQVFITFPDRNVTH